MRTQPNNFSTRPATTVAVPGYWGNADGTARSSGPIPQIALVPQRRAGVSAPRAPVQLYESTRAANLQDESPSTFPPELPRYQGRPRPGAPIDEGPADSFEQPTRPPSLPRFRDAPLDRPVPPTTSPRQADPFSTRPCGPPPPFGDAGDEPLDSPCKYTWNNVYFFGLGDVFRNSDQHTRAGLRVGLNWGLPVFDDEIGLGLQLGGSASIAEEGLQEFLTAGVFYRGDMSYDAAWNVGATIDWMQDNEFDADAAQVRLKTSVTFNRRNEIGIWGAAGVLDDDKKNGETAETVDQANLFYRRLFESGWDVTGSVGWRSDPGSFAVGGTGTLPINDFWAWSFGGYYAPTGDSWNVFAGLVCHWGPRARQDFIGQDRHQPYLPVADNSSMTLFVD